ncbi:prolyl oligopeptidase family serine peptidase [Draconibacterium sp. IB214405]|uniref:prolyl oligopeptidase family serine peptidase n=1 Tax=Draconibacterium sp. IB214405 TaxID=3097352 RepID=UPI002A0C883D|nr:prolyl oligopeptidase family serine peptidase [Draconibacterium sp. IB214405]MDX8340721.1 prolyl oligopeptidase family serine peptidase [Draconibacterium sp. IB214405]
MSSQLPEKLTFFSKYCLLACLYIFVSVHVGTAQDFKPVTIPKIPVYDTFFADNVIEDDYRYLEDFTNPEYTQWLQSQKKEGAKYLNKTSSKSNSFQAIDRYSYTDFNRRIKKGDYYFFYAYYNNQGTPALYYQTALHSKPKILVDPNYGAGKDNIVLKGYFVSGDSKYLAYQFSRNGSDWAELKVVEIAKGIHLDDELTGLKFSNVEWLNDGFFYTTYDQKGDFGKTINQKVYYHKLGTAQKDDKLIFHRKRNPDAEFDYVVTSNERFFVLKEVNPQAKKINIFYLDYQAENPVLRPLLTNLKDDVIILDSHEGKFLAKTSYNSENGKLVLINPKDPQNWEVVAANYNQAILLATHAFQDRIVCVYQANQRPLLVVFDYSGKALFTMEFPVATSLSGFYGGYNDEEVLFSLRSFTVPPVIYKFNLLTFERELTERTTVSFNFSKIKYEELEYMTDDSVMVPIVLVYEEGIKLDGSNLTLLEAYGGFGSILQPSYDPGIVYFIKKGGIYAFANIRGGGDKGLDWARAGRGINKQRSFDDFINAAEFLINNKYTSNENLAITGVSNGGLVVAASVVQRPDLFKVAVPIVAPLDMIRFEHFTVGNFHTDEYGSVSDSLGFFNLKSYSPYNNISETVNYPSMLVVTSEFDDRVPPFHSYKFVAKMQNRPAQKNPVVLKVEENSGHYGASTLYSNVKESSDIMGFIMYELDE